MLAFLAFWCFFVGSAFGSFLNVVVWRLPLGMNLSFPLSHCPKCGKPIRRRHNIPVVGWLMLRGRCYDCGQPISKRYPLIEFLCGCAFLLIFWGISPAVEFFFTPLSPPASEELIAIHAALSAKLLTLVCLVSIQDAALLLTILAVGLITLDGSRVPLKLFVPFWVIFGVCVVSAWLLLPAGLTETYLRYFTQELRETYLQWHLWGKGGHLLAPGLFLAAFLLLGFFGKQFSAWALLLAAIACGLKLAMLPVIITAAALALVYILSRLAGREAPGVALALPVFLLVIVIILKNVAIHAYLCGGFFMW